MTVVTHGWTAEWDEKSWLNNARDAFRSKTSNNFVGVDWSGGSQVLDYPQAAANTQAVGRAIAYMGVHHICLTTVKNPRVFHARRGDSCQENEVNGSGAWSLVCHVRA